MNKGVIAMAAAGFIGTGNMGRMLVEAMIRSGALPADRITACNRTPRKAEELAEAHSGLRVVPAPEDVARLSEIVFICVRPVDVPDVVASISSVVGAHQLVVPIASPISVEDLESILPAKVALVIPSVVNRALCGATLCVYGKRATDTDIRRLESLLSPFSTPVRIEERFVRIASDLSSCGPAFLALFLQKFVDAAVAETGIDRELAGRLVSAMTLGTAKLLTAESFTFASIRERVAVPGGITALGLEFLEREWNDVFVRLVRATHAKFAEDCTAMRERLNRRPR